MGPVVKRLLAKRLDPKSLVSKNQLDMSLADIALVDDKSLVTQKPAGGPGNASGSGTAARARLSLAATPKRRTKASSPRQTPCRARIRLMA